MRLHCNNSTLKTEVGIWTCGKRSPAGQQCLQKRGNRKTMLLEGGIRTLFRRHFLSCLLSLLFPVMVNAAHIGHGGRGDDQAGHAEETSDRQLTRRERMFHFSDGAFDGSSGVLAFQLALPHFAASLGHSHLVRRKSQAEGGTLLPRLSRAAFLVIKGTGLAA